MQLVIIFNKESGLKRHFRLYLQKTETLFICCWLHFLQKLAEIMISPLIGVSRFKPWISDAGKLTSKVAREKQWEGGVPPLYSSLHSFLKCKFCGCLWRVICFIVVWWTLITLLFMKTHILIVLQRNVLVRKTFIFLSWNQKSSYLFCGASACCSFIKKKQK